MPSTRALLATNHSLAGRSGSAFQVRYPNRLLCSTGSLAPSSILSTALLLGSLLLQPLAFSPLSETVRPRWNRRPYRQQGTVSRPALPTSVKLEPARVGQKAVSREALTLAWFHTHETRRRYGTTSSLRKANSILYPIVVFFVR
ncbi:hypothetical protein CKAN_02744000 [Cinnamomum micranthum f. kanehirae]|uniref:Uncharacterized protein n=1 Tax=Cinnamomum micranthum f. kanehirae TaxID=337451 RepID=A0A443Q4L0_9MAGN|nr:hypothetical protein CKAN_02744000 [Cinnamomum micranthum f. kanehirae]